MNKDPTKSKQRKGPYSLSTVPLNDLGDSRNLLTHSLALTFGIKRKRDSLNGSQFILLLSLSHAHARSSLVPSDQIQTTYRSFPDCFNHRSFVSTLLYFSFLIVCSIISFPLVFGGPSSSSFIEFQT